MGARQRLVETPTEAVCGGRVRAACRDGDGVAAADRNEPVRHMRIGGSKSMPGCRKKEYFSTFIDYRHVLRLTLWRTRVRDRKIVPDRLYVARRGATPCWSTSVASRDDRYQEGLALKSVHAAAASVLGPVRIARTAVEHCVAPVVEGSALLVQPVGSALKRVRPPSMCTEPSKAEVRDWTAVEIASATYWVAG